MKRYLELAETRRAVVGPLTGNSGENFALECTALLELPKPGQATAAPATSTTVGKWVFLYSPSTLLGGSPSVARSSFL